MTPRLLGLFGSLGWTEIIVIAGFGLLIFGRRLPEVARSVGRSIVEFKRGLADAKDEVDRSASAGRSLPRGSDPDEHAVPRSVDKSRDTPE